MNNSEKYFTHPIDMDIMKCLISNGHYCSFSGGPYPIKNHNDCTLALYFKSNIQIKSFCPISVTNIASNFKVQLNPNENFLAVIKRSPTECRCSRNTENNIISPPLAMINLPKGCTIYSTDFIIPAVNSFSS